jgi:hypothetical protein
MKKLRMDLNEIRVERFETLPADAGLGTVLGNAPTRTAVCGSCVVDSCVTGAQSPCPNCP